MSTIFYEGQQVGCLMYGEGRVAEVTGIGIYSIRVNFVCDHAWYTKEGKYDEELNHTLYPIEQYRAIIANIPAPEPEKWQPKPGEWCMFWDDNHNGFLVARFDKFSDGSYRYKIKSGAVYKHCAPFTGELPEHLKGGAE